jgi:hypothetical protein
MNIVYDINPTTGIMRLKFKDNLLKSLDKDNREAFDKYLLPLLAMNDKFVLTGSLSLKLLGFEPLDKVGDFDIGLTSAFTEEEFITIKNFFGFFTSYEEKYDYKPDKKEFDPNAHLWQFSKHWEVSVSVLDDTLNRSAKIKIDIFNDEMLRKKDIIEIWYDDFPIHLVHPSITYSYRMRYALDQRGSTTFKYWECMSEFMRDAKQYYLKIRAIYKMISHVHEHNVNVEGNKDKILKIRELVDKRAYNMENFFEKVFKETLDPFTLTMEKEHENFIKGIKLVDKIKL